MLACDAILHAAATSRVFKQLKGPRCTQHSNWQLTERPTRWHIRLPEQMPAAVLAPQQWEALSAAYLRGATEGRELL